MRIYRPKTRGRPSPTWWIDATEGGTRIRESLNTTDRRVAEARAAERLDQERREQIAQALGVQTHSAAREAPVIDLAEEYRGELERRGTTRRWRALTMRRIKALCERMGTAKLGEITPEKIARALPTLASGRTQNYYRQSLSGLYRWLIAHGRWDSDPCAAVQRARVVEGRRRRSLRAEELSLLLDHAPPHRRLVYLVACMTGLRREELNKLPISDVDLEGLRVVARAKRAKGRKTFAQPIDQRTADLWRSYLADPKEFRQTRFMKKSIPARWRRRIEAGLALPTIPQPKTIRRDLAAVGVVVGEDEQLDLHCLRVTYVSLLQSSGAGLTEAQQLARHSDPRLTANIYTRIESAEARGRVEAMGERIEKAKRSGGGSDEGGDDGACRTA